MRSRGQTHGSRPGHELPQDTPGPSYLPTSDSLRTPSPPVGTGSGDGRGPFRGRQEVVCQSSDAQKGNCRTRHFPHATPTEDFLSSLPVTGSVLTRLCCEGRRSSRSIVGSSGLSPVVDRFHYPSRTGPRPRDSAGPTRCKAPFFPSRKAPPLKGRSRGWRRKRWC